MREDRELEERSTDAGQKAACTLLEVAMATSELRKVYTEMERVRAEGREGRSLVRSLADLSVYHVVEASPYGQDAAWHY